MTLLTTTSGFLTQLKREMIMTDRFMFGLTESVVADTSLLPLCDPDGVKMAGILMVDGKSYAGKLFVDMNGNVVFRQDSE